jgi:hypothetical protein
VSPITTKPVRVKEVHAEENVLVSTALARDRVASQHTAFARPRYRVLALSGAHSGPIGPAGGILAYRSAGQTRALVRHGADPREALAEVLGVSAEDILVKEYLK